MYQLFHRCHWLRITFAAPVRSQVFLWDIQGDSHGRRGKHLDNWIVHIPGPVIQSMNLCSKPSKSTTTTKKNKHLRKTPPAWVNKIFLNSAETYPGCACGLLNQIPVSLDLLTCHGHKSDILLLSKPEVLIKKHVKLKDQKKATLPQKYKRNVFWQSLQMVWMCSLYTKHKLAALLKLLDTGQHCLVGMASLRPLASIVQNVVGCPATVAALHFNDDELII